MPPETNNQSTVLLAWSKLVPVSEGQDPLGLNLRVSARLSGQLLHCITSITPRARYFSFFPWCVSEFNRREKSGNATASLRDAIRLREKALTLGCVLHHDGQACDGGGLVGSKQAIAWLEKHPDEPPKFSKLVFTKNPALDAYFNSLVHLGFFVADEDQAEEIETEETPQVVLDELELTPLGQRVADAYEAAAGKLPIASSLPKQPDGCSPQHLKKWGAVGGLCELSKPESPDRELLRNVFFNHVGSPGESHRFRHASLLLLLELVRQFSLHDLELNEDSFNDAVYFGKVEREDDAPLLEVTLPGPLEDIGYRWRMFHFHFYLSVALESLFVSVVSKARSTGLKGFRLEALVETLNSKNVTKHFESRLSAKLPAKFLDSTPRELFKAAGVDVTAANADGSVKLEHLLGWSHPFSESSLALVFHEIDRDTPEGIATALLLVVAATTRFIRWEATGQGSWLAQAVGDAYKDVTVPVVLRELRERFPDYWNTSWREIAAFVMRRFVIRQHEVLAYEKNWDGSRAFFHSENDLIRWRQLNYDEIGVGNARFSRALQILRDLALVERRDGEKKLVLTPDGGQWLQRELTALAQQ
jgi:hypothetical protein